MQFHLLSSAMKKLGLQQSSLIRCQSLLSFRHLHTFGNYGAQSIKNSVSKHQDKLLTQYRHAMQLEANFFSSQPFTPPKRSFNLLVVDFDDTCTLKDTSSLIATAAIQATSDKIEDENESLATKTALELKLQWLVDNYMAKRNALLEDILPPGSTSEYEFGPQSATDSDGEETEDFDMTWLGDFMDRLSDFDREMNKVVIESEILAGIKRGTLSTTASTIPLRPGCVELLKNAAESGIPTCVVSVNWSSEMVRAALAHQGLPAVCDDGQSSGITAGSSSTITVYANELEYFGDESTGKIKRKVECGTDKGRVFEELLLTMAAEGDESLGNGLSVFIGDSMTDIPALLSADVGIILGDNHWVTKVCSVANIKLQPLVTFPIDSTQLYATFSAEQPVLYQADNWKEVEAFLFNSQCVVKPPSSAVMKQTSFGRRSDSSNLLLRRTISGTTATGTTTDSGALTMAGGVSPPRVLVIAGSDSGGGAGIQADIKACMANGVYASTAVTALTAQNTHGVHAVHVPPVDFIRQQIKDVLDDIGADVVKIGMLPTVDVVNIVADELASSAFVGPIVVDPVLVASSGDALARSGVVEALQQKIFPMATIITPNIPEASVILDQRVITDIEGMKAAAEDILLQTGCRYVLIKGGHLALSSSNTATTSTRAAATAGGGSGINSSDDASTVVVDILFDGKNHVELPRPYINTTNTHGTGCTLASSIAAELAKGHDVPVAVQRAQKYVWRAIERSVGLSIGSGSQMPMNHGYRIADWNADMQNTSLMTNAVDLRLYAVTDAAIIQNKAQMSLYEAVRLAIDGGATVVQLREKSIDGGRFAENAAAVLELCRRSNVPLIINDRVDVALAVGADGVHIGQNDLPAADVRRMLGPDAIIGVSVKTVEQAIQAQADGADYVGAGAVFATDTKLDSSVLAEGVLKDICEAVQIPVVAIGGIGMSGVQECIEAGCKGVAVVGAIFGKSEPGAAARELRAAVDGALNDYIPKRVSSATTTGK